MNSIPISDAVTQGAGLRQKQSGDHAADENRHFPFSVLIASSASSSHAISISKKCDTVFHRFSLRTRTRQYARSWSQIAIPLPVGERRVRPRREVSEFSHSLTNLHFDRQTMIDHVRAAAALARGRLRPPARIGRAREQCMLAGLARRIPCKIPKPPRVRF